MRLRQNESIGKVRLQQSRCENVAGKIRSLVGIAFPATRAASEAIRNVVLCEHIGEALDFSRVWYSENYLRAAGDQLLNLFNHGRHGAVEASGGLRNKSRFRSSLMGLARQPQIFKIRSGQRRGFSPPVFGRQI